MLFFTKLNPIAFRKARASDLALSAVCRSASCVRPAVLVTVSHPLPIRVVEMRWNTWASNKQRNWTATNSTSYRESDLCVYCPSMLVSTDKRKEKKFMGDQKESWKFEHIHHLKSKSWMYFPLPSLVAATFTEASSKVSTTRSCKALSLRATSRRSRPKNEACAWHVKHWIRLTPITRCHQDSTKITRMALGRCPTFSAAA